jgi:uncharacterized protein YifN (PemK superfamily)
MPHAFRIYTGLLSVGFTELQSSACAEVVERAKSEGSRYSKDGIGDLLFDGGFTEIQAEEVSAVLRHCFRSEVFSVHFDEDVLKFRLVRAKIPSVQAVGLLSVVNPAVVTRRDAYPRVPIKFVPGAGRVIMCDFTHLVRPEMVKERRAIVVAKASSDRCAVVVPISKNENNEGNPKYHKFKAGSYPFFHKDDPVWAICDHVYTVSLTRTWQVQALQRPTLPTISVVDFSAIRRLLGESLGLLT